MRVKRAECECQPGVPVPREGQPTNPAAQTSFQVYYIYYTVYSMTKVDILTDKLQQSMKFLLKSRTKKIYVNFLKKCFRLL